MGLRETYRGHVRDEVKRVALDQLAAGGPQAVSVNAIARELGVSGPALYRYFANRDELLTELVVDAYDDLAAALAPARDAGEAARLYRGWALAQPHRYRLLFAPPLPGMDAHSDRLVAAAGRSMEHLVRVVRAAGPPPRPLADQLRAWAGDRGLDVEPGLALAAVRAWSRLHGLVSLELGGNLASMGLDAADLVELEVS
jgi:AcrR family transcriptional regulator